MLTNPLYENPHNFGLPLFYRHLPFWLVGEL